MGAWVEHTACGKVWQWMAWIPHCVHRVACCPRACPVACLLPAHPPAGPPPGLSVPAGLRTHPPTCVRTRLPAVLQEDPADGTWAVAARTSKWSAAFKLLGGLQGYCEAAGALRQALTVSLAALLTLLWGAGAGTGGWKGAVRLWNTRAGKALRPHGMSCSNSATACTA